MARRRARRRRREARPCCGRSFSRCGGRCRGGRRRHRRSGQGRPRSDGARRDSRPRRRPRPPSSRRSRPGPTWRMPKPNRRWPTSTRPRATARYNEASARAARRDARRSGLSEAPVEELVPAHRQPAEPSSRRWTRVAAGRLRRRRCRRARRLGARVHLTARAGRVDRATTMTTRPAPLPGRLVASRVDPSRYGTNPAREGVEAARCRWD